MNKAFEILGHLPYPEHTFFMEIIFQNYHQILFRNKSSGFMIVKAGLDKVELQWLEYLWDHRNLFEIWVVQATEG